VLVPGVALVCVVLAEKLRFRGRDEELEDDDLDAVVCAVVSGRAV
jgi:hypothetical protein